ncbi:hypothetical protein [Virgibacillus sp. SK37]|uniref:hypothetical protein n=1 Tax=Virgibacillus sp. SK37 TaxID=403957 RepID=UPI0004D1CCE1|nr:hypothetical protein [Virgibacillus sp. SK37]AIF45400.1 hypothetical protein X953_09975 [Virgibacillus sp. SK37]
MGKIIDFNEILKRKEKMDKIKLQLADEASTKEALKDLIKETIEDYTIMLNKSISIAESAINMSKKQSQTIEEFNKTMIPSNRSVEQIDSLVSDYLEEKDMANEKQNKLDIFSFFIEEKGLHDKFIEFVQEVSKTEQNGRLDIKNAADELLKEHGEFMMSEYLFDNYTVEEN